jgi:hypothetical protein
LALGNCPPNFKETAPALRLGIGCCNWNCDNWFTETYGPAIGGSFGAVGMG